jgi:beta-lactamase class D
MLRYRHLAMLSLAAAIGVMTLAAPALAANAAPVEKPIAAHAAYPHPTALLLRRAGQDTEVVHGSDLVQTAQTPASTFKPLLALIALQTGALTDADEILPWDGRPYPRQPQWQKAMALAEAMQSSSESYFRQLAERIGRDQLADWVSRVGYGNARIGERADTAWHAGALSITAHQQLDFIDRLRRNDLPFDQRHLDSVKRTMLNVDRDGVRIYGKTGTAMPPGRTGLGWWVGWVERNGEQTSFVLLAQLNQFDGRDARIAHANELLREAGVLSVLP